VRLSSYKDVKRPRKISKIVLNTSSGISVTQFCELEEICFLLRTIAIDVVEFVSDNESEFDDESEWFESVVDVESIDDVEYICS